MNNDYDDYPPDTPRESLENLANDCELCVSTRRVSGGIDPSLEILLNQCSSVMREGAVFISEEMGDPSNMIDEIEVQTKDIYGQAKIYPVCDTAKMLARLAGTKTLTPASIVLIKQLGYSITESRRSH